MIRLCHKRVLTRKKTFDNRTDFHVCKIGSVIVLLVVSFEIADIKAAPNEGTH